MQSRARALRPSSTPAVVVLGQLRAAAPDPRCSPPNDRLWLQTIRYTCWHPGSRAARHLRANGTCSGAPKGSSSATTFWRTGSLTIVTARDRFGGMRANHFARFAALAILGACGPQTGLLLRGSGEEAGVASGGSSSGLKDSGSGLANSGSAEAAGSTPASSCASPNDCWAASRSDQSPSCCTNGMCSYTLPPACTDAGLIRASNYDQSCVSDSDCVLIREGSPCYAIGCVSGAINRAAQAQYEADLIGNCSQFPFAPSCTPVFACCVNSTCQISGCNPPGGDP